MVAERRLVHETAEGARVYVSPGRIGPEDFLVSFRLAGECDDVAPSHWDLVLEFYEKYVSARGAFQELGDHVSSVVQLIEAADFRTPDDLNWQPSEFERLVAAGVVDGEGWELELLLVVFELVMIQELANGVNWRRYTGGYSNLFGEPEYVDGVVGFFFDREATPIAWGEASDELRSLLGLC